MLIWHICTICTAATSVLKVQPVASQILAEVVLRVVDSLCTDLWARYAFFENPFTVSEE